MICNLELCGLLLVIKDNYLFSQALLNEEKAMSAKNQVLKLDSEKLADQVKTSEEGK